MSKATEGIKLKYPPFWRVRRKAIDALWLVRKAVSFSWRTALRALYSFREPLWTSRTEHLILRYYANGKAGATVGNQPWMFELTSWRVKNGEVEIYIKQHGKGWCIVKDEFQLEYQKWLAKEVLR